MSVVKQSSNTTVDDQLANNFAYKLQRLLPTAAAALSYPFLLDAFHVAVSPARGPISIVRTLIAALFLLAAMIVPLLGLVFTFQRTGAIPSPFEVRARRLAYIIVGVPPFYVLTGVALGLLHLHVNDELVWIVCWLSACAYVLFG